MLHEKEFDNIKAIYKLNPKKTSIFSVNQETVSKGGTMEQGNGYNRTV